MRKPVQPPNIDQFQAKYPAIWDAFAKLAEQCHESGGPLDERSRRLVKLGIAIGFRHEGAVHSAARHALEGGLSPDDLMHAALLAVTTIGWPAAHAAMTWILDTAATPAGELVPE
jgi:alkylhydroperoxidase/carboxymuconolactone decarboxylase family protein YurZ